MRQKWFDAEKKQQFNKKSQKVLKLALVTTNGKDVGIQIQRDWTPKSIVFRDDLTGEKTTSAKELKLDEGGKLHLCVTAPKKGSIISLKISKIKK